MDGLRYTHTFLVFHLQGKGGKGADDEEKVEERVSSVFIPSIEAAVQEFVAKWQDRDEMNNFFQKCVGPCLRAERLCSQSEYSCVHCLPGSAV